MGVTTDESPVPGASGPKVEGSSAPSVASTMDTYEQWQKLLADVFLHPHHGPTVFFVDDSELGRLNPGEDSARNLSAAVRCRLRLTAGRSMFNPLLMAYRRWQRGPKVEPPPVLPVIAISVLAATRMRSDKAARSTNYYLRLAQTILPDGTDSGLEALRRDLEERRAFLHVVDMWVGLHHWIEGQQGDVGTSTIPEVPHPSRIGYPLSQALVRQSDRASLTRLFQALNLSPGDSPSPETLLRALDIWAEDGRNRLSEAFMGALADSQMRSLLGSVVVAHARAWDGRVVTSEGKQNIAVKLSIDLDTWQTRWLFPVPKGGPRTLVLAGQEESQGVTLSAVEGREYYTDHNAPAVTFSRVCSGFQLRGGEFAAVFPPSGLVFFSPDPQTGAWSSVPGMVPYEEHVVAVISQHAVDFRRLLEEAAAEGWRRVPQRRSFLIEGYELFQRVRFFDGQALRDVLSRLPGLRTIGAVSEVVPRAKLVHGLPVASSISAHHYLSGGAPDLLLPFGREHRIATVTLDGRRDRVPANGFPLPIRRFVDEAGRHVVQADGQELVFTTVGEGPDPAPPAGTARLGWTSSGQMSESNQADAAVMGALVPGITATGTVLGLRGRDESWLLHEDGHGEKVAEPPPPRFLSSIDIEFYSPVFEIGVASTARWLAQRRGPLWRLTEIGPASPKHYEVEIDLLDGWKRACTDTNGARLWKMRLQIAGDAA